MSCCCLLGLGVGRWAALRVEGLVDELLLSVGAGVGRWAALGIIASQ
jgi:hypothetical protein